MIFFFRIRHKEAVYIKSAESRISYSALRKRLVAVKHRPIVKHNLYLYSYFGTQYIVADARCIVLSFLACCYTRIQ